MYKSALMYATALVCLLVATACPAYAYIDPSIGTMFFQGIVGGVAVMVVVLRKYWGKVKLFARCICFRIVNVRSK